MRGRGNINELTKRVKKVPVYYIPTSYQALLEPAFILTSQLNHLVSLVTEKLSIRRSIMTILSIIRLVVLIRYLYPFSIYNPPSNDI